MKTFLATLTVLVGGITLAQAAPCPSVASLSGTYGYVTNGYSARSLSANNFGNTVFDIYAAAGNFTIAGTAVTVNDTVSINGNLFRQESYGGTVSMNPANCIGTLVLNSGVIRTAYDFVVTQGGAKFLMVDSDQGTIISGSAER